MVEWISVGDRDPVNESDVLINSPERDPHVLQGYYTDGKWWTYDHIVVLVTHWMPLPEAPTNG